MPDRPTPRAHPSERTRLALIKAAERLFADRGIDATSLREVSLAAGQANTSAVAYHFGSRDDLVDAILARHSVPIHATWDAQLDLLERQDVATLRALMEILVLPLVAKLDDPDGGWEFLSISAQLSVSPRKPLMDRPITRSPTVQRFIEATLPFHAAPPALLPIRFERMASMLYAGIVGWRRVERSGEASVTRAAFQNDVIDGLMQVVQQPPSEATRAQLATPPPAPAPVPRPSARPSAPRRRRARR